MISVRLRCPYHDWDQISDVLELFLVLLDLLGNSLRILSHILEDHYGAEKLS